MTYGVAATVRSNVRKRIGNPPTSEIVDSDIDDAITKSASIINIVLAKPESDWQTTDEQYDGIVYVEELIASSFIGDTYDSPAWHQKAQDWREEAYRILDALAKNPQASWILLRG